MLTDYKWDIHPVRGFVAMGNDISSLSHWLG
ncbi:MAG: hypothetical protein ACI9FJ_003196 [Alteromonadaceae bacterium]